MPLIRSAGNGAGQVVDDPWTLVGDDEPLPENGPVIVTLARWQQDRESLIASGRPLGVRLATDQLAGTIAGDLPHLSLIALEFPSFRDGRAYSTARQLRDRYGFRGELRAVGNVLRDQLLFMHRCGFDAFEVPGADAAAAFARALGEFSVFYQPASDQRLPATRLRPLRSAAE